MIGEGELSVDGEDGGKLKFKYMEIKKQYQDEWRERVFKRDGCKCRVCGGEENIHLAHITPAKAFVQMAGDLRGIGLSYREDNLITLCRKCHRGQHRGAKAKWDEYSLSLLRQKDELRKIPEVQKYIEVNKQIAEYLEGTARGLEGRRARVKLLFSRLKNERGWGSAISSAAIEIGYRENLDCYPLKGRRMLKYFAAGRCVFSCATCKGKVEKCDKCGLTYCSYHISIHQRGQEDGGVRRRVKRCEVADGLAVPDAELVKMHIEGKMSAVGIAEQIKEPHAQVRARLKKLGCYRKGLRSLRKGLDFKRMVGLYERGYSPAEIGAAMGASRNTVRRHLKNAGLALRRGTPVGYVKAKILSGEAGPETLRRFAGRKGGV